MAATAVLGNLLPPASTIFRAFTARDFLDANCELTDRAYHRHRPKDDDGLSFGLTAEDPVRTLNKNYGVSSLPVDAVRALPGRGLEVRDDPTLAGHALMHGVPFYEDDDKLAIDVAWELVSISTIVHNKPYYLPGHARYRAPVPAG